MTYQVEAIRRRRETTQGQIKVSILEQTGRHPGLTRGRVIKRSSVDSGLFNKRLALPQKITDVSLPFQVLARVHSVFERVLISHGRTGPFCAPMHTTSGFALDSRRNTGGTFAGFCTAPGTRPHSQRIAFMSSRHSSFSRVRWSSFEA